MGYLDSPVGMNERKSMLWPWHLDDILQHRSWSNLSTVAQVWRWGYGRYPFQLVPTTLQGDCGSVDRCRSALCWVLPSLHCLGKPKLKPNKHQKRRETPENPGRNCGCIHYLSIPSSSHLPIMFQSTLLIFHHSNISEKFGIKDCAWQPCSKRCSFFCPRGTVGQSEQLGIDDYQ